MALIHYENDFEKLIEEDSVVDFYATWCGPCKMFGPIFEEVSNEIKMNFIKVDVDDNPEISRENGVMSIPTIILFKEGKEVKRFTGFMSKENFIKFINEK